MEQQQAQGTPKPHRSPLKGLRERFSHSSRRLATTSAPGSLDIVAGPSPYESPIRTLASIRSRLSFFDQARPSPSPVFTQTTPAARQDQKITPERTSLQAKQSNARDSGNSTVVPLRQLPLTFAVDVSGSTQGRILRHEKAAVLGISDCLESPATVNKSAILPWSHKPGAPIAGVDVDRLTSGGGTDPSVILGRTTASRSFLQQSDLWFLLTDGYIDQPLIEKFANALTETQMHGTACAIILFGFTNKPPFECNVSVGLSVFALAPHCIFLFHDVETARVYVFQAKGCFSQVLPAGKSFTIFGAETKWEDLARISYADLASVAIPSAIKTLEHDTILLPDGREFDMNLIYNNTISEADKLDLLSDYSALDVIILAAKTRGREDDISNFVELSLKAAKDSDPVDTARECFDTRAVDALKAVVETAATLPESIWEFQPTSLWQRLRIVSLGQGLQHPSLWDKLRGGASSATLNTLRRTLRDRHNSSWEGFLRDVGRESEISPLKTQVLSEISATISHYRTNSTCSTPALGMMSTPYGAPSTQCRTSALSSVSRNEGQHQPVSVLSKPQQSGLLFLPGYKGNRRDRELPHASHPGHYDTCAVCGEPHAIQTLLLRSQNPGGDTTPHLPQPNSRAGHKYPLVLGNYPETDVILPLATCDACAWAFLKAGYLPNGDRVSFALPLVPLENRSQNCREWEKTLGKVYGNRFNDETALLVFLSTLCCTIEDLEDADEPAASGLLKSLEWCCRQICELHGVSTLAGLTPSGSALSSLVEEMTPFSKALFMAFSLSDSPTPDRALFEYPMDGFVVMVRLAELVGCGIPLQNLDTLVWNRLLMSFVEAHARLEAQRGWQAAKEALHGLVTNKAVPPEKPDHYVKSLSLQKLIGSYLLPRAVDEDDDEDDEGDDPLSQFRRTGERFSVIEQSAEHRHALASFLHLLHESVVRKGRATAAGAEVLDVYVGLRQTLRPDAGAPRVLGAPGASWLNAPVLDEAQHEAVRAVVNVFDAPWQVGEAGAARVIEKLHSREKEEGAVPDDWPSS